jgi:hypothetical protein
LAISQHLPTARPAVKRGGVKTPSPPYMNFEMEYIEMDKTKLDKPKTHTFLWLLIIGELIMFSAICYIVYRNLTI